MHMLTTNQSNNPDNDPVPPYEKVVRSPPSKFDPSVSPVYYRWTGAYMSMSRILIAHTQCLNLHQLHIPDLPVLCQIPVHQIFQCTSTVDLLCRTHGRFAIELVINRYGILEWRVS